MVAETGSYPDFRRFDSGSRHTRGYGWTRWKHASHNRAATREQYEAYGPELTP